ncbi:MAG: hypothetical protein QXJ03_02940 [Desulfurococcus sp.]|uniref:hypothetical protein n=1 Tax=Desulfurococcus sp. TaxID=51678 RepID=UPI0031682590
MALAGGKLLKVTRIGKYHRTTVPGEAWKLLEVGEGDEIAWFLEEGRIVIEKYVKGGNHE